MTKTPVHSVVNYSENFFVMPLHAIPTLSTKCNIALLKEKTKKKRGGQQRAKDSGHPNSASPW